MSSEEVPFCVKLTLVWLVKAMCEDNHDCKCSNARTPPSDPVVPGMEVTYAPLRECPDCKWSWALCSCVNPITWDLVPYAFIDLRPEIRAYENAVRRLLRSL